MLVRASNRLGFISWPKYTIPPILVIVVLWFTSINEVSYSQAGLAFVLTVIPWVSYLSWRRKAEEELPLFALLAFMYWVYYAVSVFWGDLTVPVSYSPVGQELRPEVVTKSLLIVLIGICALWLGMKSKLGMRLIPRKPPEVALRSGSKQYLRLILLVGAFLGVSESFTSALGPGGRQAITIFVSVVPMIAFAILFRQFLRGESAPLDRILLVVFFVSRLLAGLSSGWLGTLTSIIVICGAVYLSERKRIPRLAVMLVIASTLFLQVGKKEFRTEYWTEREEAGKFERAKFWLDVSLSKWGEVATNPTRETFNDAVGLSINRVALLAQTANVLEQTPTVVPYQNGRLYYYLLVTWIPRAVWPDKPSINEANQFYQVAYGLSTEDNLGTVSIAVGILAEGFINFGIYGVIGIMFLVGIFFDFYKQAFLSKSSGLFLTAVGLVLIPQFMAIESQLAQYLGGVVQQIALSMIVMLPVIRIRRTRSASSTSNLRILPSPS